jgi:hypothetical protein
MESVIESVANFDRSRFMVPVFHPLADKLNFRYSSLEYIQHQNPALAYKIYEDLGEIEKVID